MNHLTDKLMEKIGPFAEVVSTNKYLCSLRDGFMVAFPATMFASIAIISQYLPATFGLEGITPQWLLDFLNNFFGPIGNAIFGILGLELDLRECSNKEKEQLKEAIAHYKKMQPFLLSVTLFTHPYHEGYQAWTAISEFNSIYLTGFYTTFAKLRASRNERVQLPNIDPACMYQIDEQTISGGVIEKAGIRVPLRFNGANGEMARLKGDYSSALCWMKKLENSKR